MSEQLSFVEIKPRGGTTKKPQPNDSLASYLSPACKSSAPLFLLGSTLEVLSKIPTNTIDFCITSPPYWQKRQYDNGGIGLEDSHEEFIQNLVQVFGEIFRVLKPTGSFWLNIGDSYSDKDLLLLPYLLIDRMKRAHGWTLRNCVVWNKVKGGLDNTKDRLGNVHEPLFHLVKDKTRYFYDADAIRHAPRKAEIRNGSVVSATGVSGVRYRRQIELSTALSKSEKEAALKALEEMLSLVAAGKYSDFRMIIRGQQRATHSDEAAVSGRAKELQQRGFYFLRYHPNGAKPRDVWEIMPEDTQGRESHFAPFPEDLCKIPVLATCPAGGIVLDPFCGTGTANFVAMTLGRRSIGIDISEKYLRIAEQRCRQN